MATNRDLLKEAIADAKAVKETAITNAKLALEEAFTPHLKSMLSAKLAEMDKDDDVKEEKEEVEEMDAPSFERKNSPAGDSLKDLAPKKVGQSTVQEDKKEEVDEEINLDELLAELEDSKDLSEKKDSDEDKKDVKEDARTDAEEEGYLDGEKDEKEDMEDKMDDEEVDLEDMSEDDLKGFIEDVIKDMVADGEIEPGDEFVEDEVEVEDVEDIDVVDDVDVDVEIDEMKKPKDEVNEKKEEVDEETKKEKKEGDDRKPYSKRSMASKKTLDMSDGAYDSEMKEELESALASIDELKTELNEVNLLNAKLLYTNKIFKAKNLTESKKVKVLKAFDKAKDVRQAKTIYETLETGLVDRTINESISKGAASKATGVEPKAVKQPIIESNDVYNRMRKLAGLI
tara:strand:- start:1342 stop:2541 length:1200 start_codon:yes stop_codon:yes gene_type:complete